MIKSENRIYLNRNNLRDNILKTNNSNSLSIALKSRKRPYRIGPDKSHESTKYLFYKFIRRNWRSIFILLIGLIDTVSIACASLVSFLIRAIFPNPPLIDISKYALITFYWWILLMAYGMILGLYRSMYQCNQRQQYRTAAKVYLYTLPAIFSLVYLLKLMDLPRTYMILFAVILPLFFVVGRDILHKLKYYIQEKGLGVRNTIIYGNTLNVTKIFERIILYPELGYNIKGFILNKDDSGRSKNTDILRDTLPEYSLSNLEYIIKKENIECVLTPDLKIDEYEFYTLLNRCKENNIKFKIISPEYENLLKFSYVKDIAGIPLYSPPRYKINLLKISTKRIFDILGSLIAIILLSPIFLIISLAILIEDGWPLFFKQKRALVKGMDEFYFYKFRSMVKNAEEKQKELYKLNQTSGGLFLIDHDPRVTKVGKFIRKFSLDEIPQFFNVLKGNMSLVGPRPLSIADLSNITSDNAMGGFYQLRSMTKPGITGLWQISGRREVGFKEMVLLDLYYIENKSILFDLEIMFETVPVIVFGKGGY